MGTEIAVATDDGDAAGHAGLVPNIRLHHGRIRRFQPPQFGMQLTGQRFLEHQEVGIKPHSGFVA